MGKYNMLFYCSVQYGVNLNCNISFFIWFMRGICNVILLVNPVNQNQLIIDGNGSLDVKFRWSEMWHIITGTWLIKIKEQ